MLILQIFKWIFCCCCWWFMALKLCYLWFLLSYWKSFLRAKKKKIYLRVLQGIVKESLFHHHLESVATSIIHAFGTNFHQHQQEEKNMIADFFTWNRRSMGRFKDGWVVGMGQSTKKQIYLQRFIDIDVSRCSFRETSLDWAIFCECWHNGFDDNARFSIITSRRYSRGKRNIPIWNFSYYCVRCWLNNSLHLSHLETNLLV